MILYGSTISPFVRKAVVFAREKGIEIELRAGGMGRGGEEFAEASPFRKMPALRDPGADGGRDFTISDSTAIVHYLEAKHPEPNLIPTDPVARARTIWFEEFGDTVLMAVDGTRHPRTVSYLDAILARPSFADLVAKDAAFVARLSAA